MFDAIFWLISHIAGGFVNFFRFIFSLPGSLDMSDKETLIHIIYYGNSAEFFFVIFDLIILVLIAGLIWRNFLWKIVRGMEAFANITGRFFAWAAVLMALQQIMIVFLQRIFRVSDITISPLGYGFTKSLGWYSEELKLYNAMIVALCCAYTFVQGGHVRVDLFYAGLKHRGKRMVDMLGSLFFILPVMVLTWMFSWPFMWRHLVTPPMSATDTLEKMERKVRVLKWNVETIGVSPSGFNGYFLFKILLIAFAGMMFIQGVCFFYRSLLEYLEGEESAGKFHDADHWDDHETEAAHVAH